MPAVVHLRWLLAAALIGVASFGYAWFTKPNFTPSECVEALDLTRRIDDAREALTGPRPTLLPDAANLRNLTTQRDAAALRCRDKK
jgi:hypothetical protein